MSRWLLQGRLPVGFVHRGTGRHNRCCRASGLLRLFPGGLRRLPDDSKLRLDRTLRGEAHLPWDPAPGGCRNPEPAVSAAAYPDGFTMIDYSSYGERRDVPTERRRCHAGMAAVRGRFPRLVRVAPVHLREHARCRTPASRRRSCRVRFRERRPLAGAGRLLRPESDRSERLFRGRGARHLVGDERAFQVGAVRVECRRDRRLRADRPGRDPAPDSPRRTPSRSSSFSSMRALVRILVSCLIAGDQTITA